MKNFIAIVACVLFVIISCKPKNQYVDSSSGVVDIVSVSYSDSIKEEVKEKIIKPIDVDSVLKLNIDIDKRLASDSIYNAVGDFGDSLLFSGLTLAFTRLEKDDKVFAIASDLKNDKSVLDFYLLENKKWYLISSFETEDISYYVTVDLNNDGIKEIQTIGNPNMNGNYWNNFYSYSKTENKFINGRGFFSSEYEFKNERSRVEVDYWGSWYMPNTKSIYYWKNQKLIPYKEVEVGLKIADMRHDAQYIRYSENLNLDKDSLELKFEKTFRGKKLNAFFDKFFENN